MLSSFLAANQLWDAPAWVFVAFAAAVVSDDDILHAIDQLLVEYEVGDDDPPRRWLVLGPNRAGLMLPATTSDM